MTKKLALALLLSCAIGSSAFAGDLVKKNVFARTAEAIQLPIEDTNRETKLQSIIAERPDFADAHFRLANHYIRVGNYFSAVDAAEQAITHAPGNAAYANTRGNLYFLMGRMTDGIARFQADLAEHPERTHLYKQIAVLQYHLQRPEAALETADAWRLAAPNDVEAAFWQGKLNRELGNYNAAISALQQALDIDANFHRAYEDLVLAYRDGDRLADGIAYMQSRIKANPETPLAWHFLSNAHSFAGNHADATIAAEQHANLMGDDEFANALHVVARALERGGDFEESLKVLFESKRADKASEFTNDRIKDLIYRVGRHQDGIDYFTRIVMQSEGVQPFHYRIIGEIAMADGQWDLAEKRFAEFLERKPYEGLAYAQYGQTLLRGEDTDAAMEAFKNAAWFNLRINDNFYRVSRMYLQNKDFEGGIAYFEEMVALFPEKAYLHAYLGDLYEAAGMNTKAADSLRKAVEFAPISSRNTNFVERINTLDAGTSRIELR